MRRDHPEFQSFFGWIEQCLRDGTATPPAAAAAEMPLLSGASSLAMAPARSVTLVG
jgi:hypothetical protein